MGDGYDLKVVFESDDEMQHPATKRGKIQYEGLKFVELRVSLNSMESKKVFYN